MSAKLRQSIINQEKRLRPDKYTFHQAEMEWLSECTQHTKLYKILKTVEIVQTDQEQGGGEIPVPWKMT